jgi:hypothetical protein
MVLNINNKKKREKVNGILNNASTSSEMGITKYSAPLIPISNYHALPFPLFPFL